MSHRWVAKSFESDYIVSITATNTAVPVGFRLLTEDGCAVDTFFEDQIRNE